MVEISTKYMLSSSKDLEKGIVLKGDLVSLQSEYNVYVHLIPEITFYEFNGNTKESEVAVEDPLVAEETSLELHPDLMALFDSTDA